MEAMPSDIGHITRTVEILSILLADASFWAGLGAVFVFSWARFNERQLDEEETDPPLAVRSFTTRFRYQLAAITYTGCYSIIYLLLIVLGTLPASQRLLISLIGTIEGKDIGTPAWAAMVATAILPAFKLFNNLDQRIRVALQRFASIPLKARHLADEIVVGLTTLNTSTNNPVAPYGAATYASVQDYIERLKASPRLSAQKAYRQFFSKYQHIFESLNKKCKALSVTASMTEQPNAPLQEQWEFVVRRLSRLVACSVLHVESDEFKAREVLYNELGIPGIQASSWRFTTSQILLGALTMISAVVLGIVGSAAYKVVTFPSTEISLSLILAISYQSLLVGALAIPMFILPLVYAAGVQMYLLDRQQMGDPLEWHELLLARIFTFCMSYALALLPAMIVAAIAARRDGGSVDFLVWAPWAIPPAAVATLFVIVSTVTWTHSRVLNTAMDFVSHASVAWLTTRLAMLLADAAGLQADVAFGVPPGTIAFVAPTTAFFVSGTMGALQCNISRHGYADGPSGPARAEANVASRPDVQMDEVLACRESSAASHIGGSCPGERQPALVG
jgi:hypothetical protein